MSDAPRQKTFSPQEIRTTADFFHGLPAVRPVLRFALPAALAWSLASCVILIFLLVLNEATANLAKSSPALDGPDSRILVWLLGFLMSAPFLILALVCGVIFFRATRLLRAAVTELRILSPWITAPGLVLPVVAFFLYFFTVPNIRAALSVLVCRFRTLCPPTGRRISEVLFMAGLVLVPLNLGLLFYAHHGMDASPRVSFLTGLLCLTALGLWSAGLGLYCQQLNSFLERMQMLRNIHLKLADLYSKPKKTLPGSTGQSSEFDKPTS